MSRGRYEESTEEKTTLRERMADAIDLSKELILDVLLITSLGDRELTLENYKGILSYSDTCIRVKGKPYPLCVKGSNLELRNITRELLYITGRIHSIEFEREKGRS